MINKSAKKVVLILILSVICQLLTVNLSIAAGEGTTGASFLKIGVGTRAVGMGESFVAVADDSSAIYWNPGGLGSLVKKELSLMHLEWFEGIKYENLTYVNPTTNSGTWGVDLKYLYMGSLKKTIVNSSSPLGYDELGTFSAYDMAATIGYGKEIFPNFNLGISLKYIKQTLDDKNATAIAGDLGFLYNLRGGKIGVSLQNLGTKLKFIKEEGELPFNIKYGISANLFEDKFILGLEVNQPNSGNITTRVGTEMWLHKFFALRFGYRYAIEDDKDLKDLDITSNFTIGMGFGKNDNTADGLGYQIDYALVPYEDFGYTHRVSLSIKFGRSFAKREGIELFEEEEKPVSEIESLPPPSQEPSEGIEDIKIAIIDFFHTKAVPLSEAGFVSRYFRGEVSKYLYIIDTDQMNTIIKKEGLKFEKIRRDKRYLEKAGKVLNVDKILIGEIGMEKQIYTLKVSIVDTKTGEIEYKDKAVYSLSNIQQAIKNLAYKVIQAIKKR